MKATTHQKIIEAAALAAVGAAILSAVVTFWHILGQ